MQRSKYPRRGFVVVAGAIALWSITSAARGQAPASQPSALSLAVPPPAPDSIQQRLIDAKERPAGILPYGPVSILDAGMDQLNAALDPVGLKLGFSYTALYQAATGGPGHRDAAGQDVDLFGNWRLFGPKGDPNNGYLYFASEWRGDMGTDIAPGGLGSEIGSLWGTTNGFGEQPLVLKEVYWEQHFGGDNLIVRVGKLDPENYYDSNYWQSDSKYFLNKAFSSFPVRSFPGQGLGVNVTAKLSEQWYISTGFQDAQGKKTTTGFDTFFHDFNLFSAGEVGYTPDIPGWGRGTYRLMAWYRDAGETDGKSHDAGASFSMDQHIGPNLIPFFRAGVGEGNINGIDDLISAGIGWQGKFITESDVIGVAGAWGRPDDHDLDDQFAGEVFYRLQVSPDNQLTVGYQVIANPSFEPDDHVVGVFELRWRVTL